MILKEEPKEKIMHFFNKDLFPLLNKYTIKGLDQDFFDFKTLMEDVNIIKSRTYKQAWKNACQVFMKLITICFDNIFLIEQDKKEQKENGENFIKDVNILFEFEKVIKEYYQNYKINEINLYEQEKCDIFSLKNFNKDYLDDFNFDDDLDEKSDLFDSKIPFSNNYKSDFIFENKNFFINNNISNNNNLKNNNKKNETISITSNNSNNKNNLKKTNITAGNNYKFKSYKYDNSKKKKIKEYKFITIKRENVDKKILRKFKKFLKHKLKEKADNEIKNYIKNNGFWPDYIKMNLMPPFSYEKENISFKSFNTKYLCWFFEHKFSLELFNIFIKIKYNELIDLIKEHYKLKEDSNDYNLLKTYINSMPMIYGNESTRSTAFSSHIAESDEEYIKKNSEQISIEEENSSENNNNSINNSIDKNKNNKMLIESEINKDNNYINNNNINNNNINFDYMSSNLNLNINSDNLNSNNHNFLSNNSLIYNDENNTEMIISPNINDNNENGENLNNSFENNNQSLLKFDKNLFNII